MCRAPMQPALVGLSYENEYEQQVCYIPAYIQRAILQQPPRRRNMDVCSGWSASSGMLSSFNSWLCSKDWQICTDLLSPHWASKRAEHRARAQRCQHGSNQSGAQLEYEVLLPMALQPAQMQQIPAIQMKQVRLRIYQRPPSLSHMQQTTALSFASVLPRPISWSEQNFAHQCMDRCCAIKRVSVQTGKSL